MIAHRVLPTLVRATFSISTPLLAATFATLARAQAHTDGMAAKETATVAGGCFWCIEAVYNEMDGVESAISGYIGGATKNPAYREVSAQNPLCQTPPRPRLPHRPVRHVTKLKAAVLILPTLQVCGGDTGHAEAVRVTYDSSKLSYKDILEVFFTVHDPTQLNKQGNDVGTQYRSAIFYHSPEQKVVAEEYIRETVQPMYPKKPVVTTLEPASTWYPAEEYHQNYFVKEPYQPYVMGVVRPKVYKARDKFKDKLKPTVK